MNTLIAATDFTDSGNAAVARAIALATRLDLGVHVIHAWTLPPTAISTEPPPAALVAQLEKRAADAMKRLLDHVHTGQVPVTSSIVCGDPREAVIAAAETSQAAMIVVGTHGRSNPQHPLIGSVAEAIVRLAPCSVLVVR